MQVLLALWWFLLILSSFRAKDVFFSSFVFTQFLFVGLGLLCFSLSPTSYLEEIFPDFNFSRIDESDFNYANVLILLGVTTSVLVYSILRACAIKKIRMKSKCITNVHSSRFYVFLGLSLVLSVYFIFQNADSFWMLALAEQSDDLAASLELRQVAVSDYLITLGVYNLCPAIGIVAVVWLGDSESSWLKRLFVFAICFLILCALLMTFQKRPLIVFLFALLLVSRARVDFYRNIAPMESLKNFFLGSTKFLILIFLILVGLYFLYTGYRFDDSSGFNKLMSIFEVVISRIVGRLSIPAAFYVDFFPSNHEHYWFSNVGLFSHLFGLPIFLDTATVFSNYSYSALNGSVAASVYSDAYGQGGAIWVPFVGVCVGALLFLMRQVLNTTPPGASKLLFMIFGIMYMYYLSQSSIFRATLGYGGVIWLMVWLLVVKKSRKIRC